MPDSFLKHDGNRLGQGIWYDPQTKDTVIVLGGGQAAVWNGTTLERLTIPFHGELRLNPQAKRMHFVNFHTLKDALENYDENAAHTAFAALKDIFMQWNWKATSVHSKERIAILVASLAAASFIQSAFDFRPLIYIGGATQSGKSQIYKRVLNHLYGHLKNRHDKPTEASVRQSVKNESRILLIDELEQDATRPKLLKMLRASTDDGVITKGTTGHNHIEFTMKNIVWIASIEMNLDDKADSSRFFQFETYRPERKADGTRATFNIDTQAVKKIGFDLMIFAVKNMKAILQTVTELAEADIPEAQPRSIEAAAVPAAFAEMLLRWERQNTLDHMYNFIHDHMPQNSTDVSDDHENLWQTILYQPIRAGHEELSVAQAIKKAYYKDDADTTNALERNGVKIVGNDVHFIHKIIKNTLLKNTKWANMGIGTLLKRLKIGETATVWITEMRNSLKSVKVPIKEIIGTEEQNEQKF